MEIKEACRLLHKKLIGQPMYAFTAVSDNELVVWAYTPFYKIHYPEEFQGYKVRSPRAGETSPSQVPYATGTGLLGQIGWIGSPGSHSIVFYELPISEFTNRILLIIFIFITSVVLFLGMFYGISRVGAVHDMRNFKT